jgi:hypothetical protein
MSNNSRWMHFKGCDHNQMNQWQQRTQRLQSFLWSFSLSHRKEFLDEFYNMLLKKHVIFSIHHIFCINFWWITNFSPKVYKFYQILHFVLKHYPNFKSYENRVIILWFSFLYHKIKICFICHVHYTTFTCGKWLLKLIYSKYFKISQISNCECFWNVGNQLTSSQKNSHQISIIKRVFNIVIYKIDYFLFNCWINTRSFIIKTIYIYIYIYLFIYFILNSWTLILVI